MTRAVKILETKTALALGIDLPSINKTSLELVLKQRADEEIESLSITRQIIVENSPVKLSSNTNGEDETPINVVKRLEDDYKLQFASNNQSLAGQYI